MSAGVALAVYAALIVLASLAGGMLPLWAGLSHSRLQVFLSFAAGVMLGAVFFHMLPEAMHLDSAHAHVASEEHGARDRHAHAAEEQAGEEHAVSVGRDLFFWTAAGLLALFLVQRVFAFHSHELPHSHHHGRAEQAHDEAGGAHTVPPAGRSGAWMALAGLAVHTVLDGFALAAAVTASSAGQTAAGRPLHADGGILIGLGTFLAIVLHKPADSLTLVSLLVRSGARQRLAQWVNFAYALAIALGILAFFEARAVFADATLQGYTARALAFSAGVFLCISLSDLLPELQFHAHDRFKLTVALLAGVLLMMATGYWHQATHAH